MRPDPDAVRSFLAGASHRRTWLAAVEGAAGGLIIGAALPLAWTLFAVAASSNLRFDSLASPGFLVGAGLAAGFIGAAARALAVGRGRRRIAHEVESRAPECRNLLITSNELFDQPERVRPEIGQRIYRDTQRLVASLELSRLFPARRPLTALGVGAACWIVVLASAPDALGPAAFEPGGEMTSTTAAIAITDLTVNITPPAYSGLEDSLLSNPSRLEALQGSRIVLEVAASAEAVSLQTIDDEQAWPLTRGEDGLFRGEVVATEDGFIALEPSAADGTSGTLRLVGLAVEPDLAPRVRITAPGQDLFLQAATARLELAVEANDDLGLASLGMNYTRVVGSGENFEFVTGEVPLQITRDGDRSWRATGTLALDTLELEPGDMVVYRGVATDRRPGALPAESDAFIVEILAPGEAAAGGFAIDDQEDRYAISQRMVIVKTERLQAGRSGMSDDAVAEAALVIAAEQRQVRAEFVFMMGGELTDFDAANPFMLHEEEEAQGEADIAAGRLANQGRIDLTRAVRSMSLAASALTAPDLTAALIAEHEALDALQRAFSKSRYILRTLTERESIDLERRLTGTLTDTARGTLPGGEPTASARGDGLRRVLADVAAVAGHPTVDPRQVAGLVALARAVLGIDPASEAVRSIAVSLADAGRALDDGRPAEARTLLDTATSMLAAEVRSELPMAPAGAGGPGPSRLHGAQADALRQSGGGR